MLSAEETRDILKIENRLGKFKISYRVMRYAYSIILISNSIYRRSLWDPAIFRLPVYVRQFGIENHDVRRVASRLVQILLQRH